MTLKRVRRWILPCCPPPMTRPRAPSPPPPGPSTKIQSSPTATAARRSPDRRRLTPEQEYGDRKPVRKWRHRGLARQGRMGRSLLYSRPILRRLPSPRRKTERRGEAPKGARPAVIQPVGKLRMDRRPPQQTSRPPRIDAHRDQHYGEKGKGSLKRSPLFPSPVHTPKGVDDPLAVKAKEAAYLRRPTRAPRCTTAFVFCRCCRNDRLISGPRTPPRPMGPCPVATPRSPR